MGMAVILSIVFGYLADKWRISCLLQIAFLVRMLGLFTFYFIDDAKSGLTYVGVVCLNVGNQCCSVVIYSLLNKALEKGTRGTVTGYYNTMGTVGVLIISKVGSYLFKEVDPVAPFIFVGALDASFFFFVLILQFMGKFKYEIKELEELNN